jgi:hypothetical protein
MVALGLMVAPSGTAGAGGSRLVGPDRRMDTGDPLGRVGTRSRSHAALVRERGEGGPAAYPARQSWSWCRRGRWSGLHSP